MVYACVGAACTGRISLSEDAVAQIVQLFEHFARRAVQLVRDRALRGHRQRRKLLAQVAVRHVLHGVAASTPRGRLGTARDGGRQRHDVTRARARAP